MKSKNNFTIHFMTVILIALSGNLIAQKNNSAYKDTVINIIKATYGGVLEYAPTNIKHIYEINIPSNVVVEELKDQYKINPVEITVAITTGYYEIYKAKITYKLIIYKTQGRNGVHLYKGTETKIW